ncbi:MAG: phage tail protein, partial [Clostridium chrysemydis]|uniref:phage tail protein n=1 Tax=Clostridium chrysemydis TaxID=2665504 RepID=UPI003F34080E
MLKLLDENKKQIALLKYVEDYRIESSLKTGNKTLTFYYSKDNEFYDYIKEESYIKTKTDEFIIKARSTEEEETSFICELNLENLEGVPFDRFESIEQPITAALNLAIVGTGWTVKENNINKKRTVRMTDCSSLDIVQEIIKVYRVDIVFDTLNKQIKVYNELGSDKGTYLIEDLNLKKLGIQSDSYNYATRIKARGKDGLTFASINGGKDYVENYQYTKKIKTIFWSDDRYTIKESLLEDAKEKLNEISKPLVSYAATIKNLALLNPIYKNILDYSLGDIITLISKSNKLKDKQRIVKIIEYPMDHSRDTLELANSTLSFEDLQTEFQDTTDTVNNITTDNGTVDGSTIDGITTKQIEDFEANVIKVTNLKAVYAEIETLKVGKADIQNLNAVTARIGTLESTKANITDLTSTNIKVANLEANKATITDLNAASGKISVLESKTASIDNLLAGNLTANNFKANSIVAGSGIIADGAIGDAQISSLNANKMRAGTLDTSLVTVCGPQGRLKILGNKLQIFDDVNNKLFERIMLGINENNRASLTLRGVDGQTVLLTEEGLTKAGITDGFNKADDNSLNASKFDKNSIVRQVNGATESINGTRVQVGDRSL